MTLNRLTIVKPSSVAEKTTRTTVDTVLITRDLVASWKHPPFQRPLRVNEKVQYIAQEISKNGGVIPGVLTIAVLKDAKYRLDGQHRLEAFNISDAKEGYADVRFFFCEDMEQMAEEFVRLQSSIVAFRPDDKLRALEHVCPPIRYVRTTCRFVGYDMIRRGETSPVLSMSLALRCWRMSYAEVPAAGAANAGADKLGMALTQDDAAVLAKFLTLCMDAWGRDSQYARLWGALNLTLCAWLYRRTVVSQYSAKTPKLTADQFRNCLLSLSASESYVEYLWNRKIGERDRSPAYDRLKRLFVTRLTAELGKRPMLPAPAWANG